MAVLQDLFTLVIGEKQQVLAFSLSCSQQQAVNFTLSGSFGRNVVGDLDALLHLVAFANYEIALSAAVVQVINGKTRYFTQNQLVKMRYFSENRFFEYDIRK